MTERLFHLAPMAAWEAHCDADEPTWAPDSLASEGFVHLSFEEQLAGTLDAHFDGHQALILLEVDPGRVSADLRLEPSRDEALFPHLYRALERDDILRTWMLGRRPDGWSLPSPL